MNTHNRLPGMKKTKPILMGLAIAATAILTQPVMAASPAPVNLRSCTNFAILAYSSITTTGGGIINGDVGLFPAGSQGIPPAQVNGTIHNGDLVAQQAQADLTIAYNDAKGRSVDRITIAGNIGGLTFAPGLYWSASSLQITGDLTLDAGGNPNAVWVFQMASTLTTAAGGAGDPHSRVILAGGAQASNIFWQVGSSATLGTYSTFAGTILAQVSITMDTDSIMDGRALARTGAVTFNGVSGSLPLIGGPIAVDDATNTPPNTPVTIIVLANDTDSDGDTLTVTGVTDPLNGTAVTNIDGTVLYTPDADYDGLDTFTYSISDGHGGVDSAIVSVIVGDVIVMSDARMFLNKMACTINWAKHASGIDADKLSIRGTINPRGAKRDLSGAAMALSVNAVQLLPAVTLNKRGTASGVTGGVTYKFRFDWLSGYYSMDMVGLDLRATVGVPNVTAGILQELPMSLAIEGANLDIPLVLGTFECPCSTRADKTSRLSFNNNSDRTPTGLYQCNETVVTQNGAAHNPHVKGVIEADGGGAVVPAGDITVKIGDAPLTIPFAQLVNEGDTWSYTGTDLAISQFSLNNRMHTFRLSASRVAGIGIPLAGPGSPDSHRLQVILQVPTAGGIVAFDSTVEILRANTTSRVWVR